MQTFCDIARGAGVEYVYVAYIEEMLLYNRKFDAVSLAKRILGAAMARREARLRKCSNAILNSDRGPTVSQMMQCKHLARSNNVMYAYIEYIESLISAGTAFDIEKCVEALFNNAMDDYKLRMARRIEAAAGICFGVDDAV